MTENRIVLEERVCRCGCGLTFKVLPSSQHYYASILHDPSPYKVIDSNKFKADFAHAIDEKDLIVKGNR